MPKIKITVDGWLCTRCAHQWISRVKRKPCICPKCGSAYWDKARKIKVEKVRKEKK
jgi:Zn finger protein HypA/HybF involved in hydrogenase expression